MNAEKKKIIVAMSGGVDSSVAALLLAQEGHDVVGVTLRLLPRGGEGFGCCGSPEDVSIAKRSAEKAGIPHYVLDYSPDFEKDVINYFVNSYIIGETPNPCLACNRHIKFDKLRVFAKSLGATHIATGHYARILSNPAEAPGFRLFESMDLTKDQSYVLFNLTQESLSTTLFPVGDKPKARVRELARQFELPNADKKDSQEICFVPNKDYRSYVKTRLEGSSDAPPTTVPGLVKDTSGKVLGEHKGVAFYTVGQRRGLNISVSKPVYVTRLEAGTNTVVVGTDDENQSRTLEANNVTWISGTPPAEEFNALVKIRYKHEPTPATVHTDGRGFRVLFDVPQRAVTPGQAVVLYRWDDRLLAREVIGGGTIKKAERG